MAKVPQEQSPKITKPAVPMSTASKRSDPQRRMTGLTHNVQYNEKGAPTVDAYGRTVAPSITERVGRQRDAEKRQYEKKLADMDERDRWSKSLRVPVSQTQLEYIRRHQGDYAAGLKEYQDDMRKKQGELMLQGAEFVKNKQADRSREVYNRMRIPGQAPITQPIPEGTVLPESKEYFDAVSAGEAPDVYTPKPITPAMPIPTGPRPTAPQLDPSAINTGVMGVYGDEVRRMLESDATEQDVQAFLASKTPQSRQGLQTLSDIGRGVSPADRQRAEAVDAANRGIYQNQVLPEYLEKRQRLARVAMEMYESSPERAEELERLSQQEILPYDINELAKSIPVLPDKLEKGHVGKRFIDSTGMSGRVMEVENEDGTKENVFREDRPERAAIHIAEALGEDGDEDKIKELENKIKKMREEGESEREARYNDLYQNSKGLMAEIYGKQSEKVFKRLREEVLNNTISTAEFSAIFSHIEDMRAFERLGYGWEKGSRMLPISARELDKLLKKAGIAADIDFDFSKYQLD